MRRFIFICVALIAFFATNASGTGYQPTDQLQTHSIVQADLPVISPAVFIENNVQPIVRNYTLMLVEKQKALDVGYSAVFKYPDYGLKSLNACIISNRYSSVSRHTIKIDMFTNRKLPSQFVQLE